MSRYRRDLFPVSIFHGSVDQNNDLKKILMPLINRTKNHDDVLEPPSGWSTNNLKTSFSSEKVNKYVFGNGDNEIENKIKSQYIKTLDGFFDKNWQIDLSEIWFNYYENGEWQEAHRHISSGLGQATHFACVHFLSFDPENHMPLRLLDPLSLHRALGFEFDSVRVSEKIDLITREGDLVMFPSWLEHEVLPGKSTPGNPRITVAFNVTVESYGDEQDGDDDV